MNDDINISNDRDLHTDDTEGHGRWRPAPSTTVDDDTEGHGRYGWVKPAGEDTEGHMPRARYTTPAGEDEPERDDTEGHGRMRWVKPAEDDTEGHGRYRF